MRRGQVASVLLLGRTGDCIDYAEYDMYKQQLELINRLLRAQFLSENMQYRVASLYAYGSSRAEDSNEVLRLNGGHRRAARRRTRAARRA